ncbi:MAG TPA: efflux RND transporter periplasmic adaptor subunit [Bryobacteraceae bacterium]|nr:efflux RND transporter periplasmic adaptor subunit [Bryobacteraceae bacterium]
MKTIFALLPAMVLISCSREEAARPKPAKTTSIPVSVAAVSMQSWPDVYEATGTVRARTAATLASKLMGYAQQVSVQVGDRVREHQVLVTLDAQDLEANLRRAEAGRAEAVSARPEVENGIAAAKANFELARATFRRIDELAAKKSVSSQEFDEASARLKAAEASYEMARARREQLQSRIAQAEQEQRAAQIMRDYAVIGAPFAGIVTAKSVEPGNLAAPGVPLLTIEREGGYRLEAEIDESKLAAVRAGHGVKVTIDALGRTFDARVSEVAPAVDTASRAYTVKIDLPAAPQLRSGLFGKAVFSLGERQTLAIPSKALRENGQLQSVFVVANGEARTRLITTGRRYQGQVEVLSGLNAGEMIAAGPPAELTDGACVEVRP